MKEYLEKWKKKLTRENMAVAALLGLLLMVIAIPAGGREKKADAGDGIFSGEAAEGEGPAGEVRTEGEEEEYAGQLEERLQELLSAMEGVGEVKVMVTLRSFGQQVVEKDIPAEAEQTQETDSAGGTRQTRSERREESTVYITEEDGSRTPYVSETIQPRVEGVTVVAQGGDDARIQKSITEVIEALFDIEAHKIKVVKMK